MATNTTNRKEDLDACGFAPKSTTPAAAREHLSIVHVHWLGAGLAIETSIQVCNGHVRIRARLTQDGIVRACHREDFPRREGRVAEDIEVFADHFEELVGFPTPRPLIPISGTIGRRAVDFTELDSEFNDLQHVLTLALEAGFADVVEEIRAAIRAQMLPSLEWLLRFGDSEETAALAQRQARLWAMLVST